MELGLDLAVVLAAVVFAWSNGFHDASNAVATSLATGALTPRVALALASCLNVLGGVVGLSVGVTLRSFATPPAGASIGLAVVVGFGVATAWNVVTWARALPSSSSHAMIGAFVGAALAAGAHVDWGSAWRLVLLPMLLSPLVGFVGAWAFAAFLRRLTQDAAHGPALRRFRAAQTVSAAAMALGHGLQDTQKLAGLAAVGLGLGLGGSSPEVPLWLRGVLALGLGLGTAFGGWRLIRTVGRRIARVDPLTGTAAETVAAASLYAATDWLALPVSTTHVLVASLAGSASVDGLRSVRWNVMARVAANLVVTPAATAALAAGVYLLAVR